MHIEINWQDQDSSSGESFRSIFPDGELSKVMLCGGHVGRSHGNNLKEYMSKKSVEKGFLDKHKKDFPELEEVKCLCYGKKHSKNCGCMKDDFLAAAKRNHFSALKQAQNDPSEYARRMRVLGKYHCRDIHSWKDKEGNDEECGFHPMVVCSCGKCGGENEEKVVNEKRRERIAEESEMESSGDESSIARGDTANGSGESGDSDSMSEVGDMGNNSKDNDSSDDSDDSETCGDSDDNEESEDSDDSEGDDGIDGGEKLECDGKPYSSRTVLKCPLHSLLYEIECARVARKATSVIHTEIGRGHSNLPESKFHVLTRFRPKNVNLHQMHYEFITNVGLCQSDMTFMFKTNGKAYHWMRELLTLMKLPIPDGIEDIWSHENEQRMRGLVKQQTKAAKTARAKRKQKRLQESKER